MTNDPRPTEPATGGPRGLQALLAYRSQIVIALFAVAAVLIGVAIFLIVRFGSSTAEVTAWVCAVAVILAGAGAFYSASTPADSADQIEQLRLLILTVGGLIGLATVILGLVLPFTRYLDTILSGMKAWYNHRWGLTGCAVAVFGGLVLTFISLQLARSVQRTSPSLRRLLYGYNATLGGFLLLAILVLFNVLPYGFAAFSKPIDWTSGGIYTLSDETRNFLADLSQPVKIIGVLVPGDPVTEDVETLLRTCQEVNPKITWELLSRDLNRREVEEVFRKYQIESLGLLVLYGTEPKVSSEFIKAQDLVRVPEQQDKNEPFRYDFLGESALMKALRSLAEGKTKPIVYFTQGEGEPELQPAAMNEQQRRDGLSMLRLRLTERSYDVRPLRFGLDTKQVPADANLVVIVRPTQPFSANALKALRDYMSGTHGSKGKLMVLTGPVIQDGVMVRTGLEDLLAEQGVRLGNDRILELAERRDPTAVWVGPNERSTNRVVQAFLREGVGFRLRDLRTVTPVQGNRSGRVVSELFFCIDQFGPIVDTDLAAEPKALVNELLQPDNRMRLKRRLEANPTPSIAVAVSESAGNLPPIAAHAEVNKEVPRLIVFGTSSWISNEATESRGGSRFADLFSSCVSWLQGRSDIGRSAEGGKQRKEYRFQPGPNTIAQMRFLPLGLLLLTVVGLGCGVWVVRRR